MSAGLFQPAHLVEVQRIQQVVQLAVLLVLIQHLGVTSRGSVATVAMTQFLCTSGPTKLTPPHFLHANPTNPTTCKPFTRRLHAPHSAAPGRAA